MDANTLAQLLAMGAQHKASDVLLKVGQPPAFRIHGSLHYVQGAKLQPDQTEAIAKVVLARSRYKGTIEELQQFDTSYAVEGVGRYRVNVYRQQGTLALAMRSIPLNVPSFEQLKVPPAIARLAELERGMVLVVGAAGNGKSSTLAALIGSMNRTRRVHIVTIEDPVEFIHEDLLGSVSQREIGLDTPDFASALRAALRQDPDIILVGEIRDEETMDIALKAAETGHLVLSTLHTPDVARTVGRVLALSPPGALQETRERFADNIKAIVAQRLVPHASGKGMVLAAEVLWVTGTARETLRKPEGNPPLKDIMDKGAHPYGMQTFETHLKELVKAGEITVDEAKAAMG